MSLVLNFIILVFICFGLSQVLTIFICIPTKELVSVFPTKVPNSIFILTGPKFIWSGASSADDFYLFSDESAKFEFYSFSDDFCAKVYLV